jgi:hypothetical protein
MLHCLIAHEVFLDAKSVFEPLKDDLYAQLDLVDACVATPSRDRGKKDLEEMTVRLHYLSRMIDPLIANAEMTAMVLRQMQASHDRYCESLTGAGLSNATTKTSDSVRYLLESAESQKRWLVSYRSRKDTTLNLVSPTQNPSISRRLRAKLCRSMRRLAVWLLKRPEKTE